MTIFGQSGGGGKVLALMAMPAPKCLFHRAIVQSGPFLKSLSPDYSRRLAELLLAELSLSKSQVQELQESSVDRLSSAAAEAMRKMHQPKSFLHPVFGEHDWGPTVNGHILPRHPCRAGVRKRDCFRIYGPGTNIFTNAHWEEGKLSEWNPVTSATFNVLILITSTDFSVSFLVEDED